MKNALPALAAVLCCLSLLQAQKPISVLHDDGPLFPGGHPEIQTIEVNEEIPAPEFGKTLQLFPGKVRTAQANATRAAAVVTWTGPSGGGDWQDPANWSSGSVPGAADDVILGTGTILILTNVPTATIGTLSVGSNTTAHLRANAAATLTIGGGPGTDLNVGTGSTLNLNGVNAVTITLPTGTSGIINGTVQVGQAAHRIIATDANSLVFDNGSLCRTMFGFSGSLFGTTNLNTVSFANGSIYAAGYGATPFGAAAPNAVCAFAPASTYRIDSSAATHSFLNRTFGVLESNSASLGVVYNGTAGTTTVTDIKTTVGTIGFFNGTLNILGNMTFGLGNYQIGPTSTSNVTTVVNFSSPTCNISLAPGGTGIFFLNTGTGTTVATTGNVLNGAVMTVNRSFNSNGLSQFRVKPGGTVNFSPTVFTGVGGTGQFIAEAGSNLGVTANTGIMATGASGNVQTTTRVFDAAANYTFNRNATALQQTGTGLPTSPTASVTINLGPLANEGLILNNSTVIRGVLNLVNGKMYLNAANLSIHSTGAMTGGGPNSYIITNGAGAFSRPNVGATPVDFPVGFWLDSYDPVRITNTGTVDSFTVRISGLPATVLNPAALVGRAYNISEGIAGGTNAALELTYAANAALGANYNTANPIFIGHYDGTTWTETAATLTGTTASAGGFASFSPFVIGNSQAQTWYQDADGDGFGNVAVTTFALNQPAGYVLDNTDCDDGNPNIHTPATYYADTDGDGYGDPANTDILCSTTPPTGYVSNNLDCDDGNPNLPANFYPDADNDSYGAAGSNPTLACTGGTGFSNNAADCNDADANINPAAAEICNNGTDENCDTYDGVGAFGHDIIPHCTNPAKNMVEIMGVVGGNPPYTYSKNGGTTYQTNALFNNLAAGTYTFVVKDNTNCTLSNDIVINQPMAASGTGSALDCYDDTDGTVEVSVSNGYPNYDIDWYLGPNLVGSGPALSGLGGGTYKASITDSEGCIRSVTVSVTEPPKLNVKLTRTNVTCFGADNGSIANLTTGGVGGYTFAWSDGSTDQSRLNLGPAIYTVTATDANGCAKSAQAEVKEPKELLVTFKAVAITCFGANNGSLEAKASGGTGTKTFLWNTGATTALISSLAPGTYTVSVTDANGCLTVASTVLSQPAAVTITSITSTPNTSGSFSVAVAATGGTTPRKFQRTMNPPTNTVWSALNGTGNFTNVPMGTYLFRVIDKNGCSTTQTKTIPVTLKPSDSNDRSIQQPTAQDFTLVPNPAKGSVALVFMGEMPTAAQVEVRDMAGRLLKNTAAGTLNGNRLSLEGLPTGVLFVTVRAENGATNTKRLVVTN